MRAIVIFALMLVSGNAVAQPGISRAVAVLNTAAKTKINWNTQQAREADVTCDGHPDTIMFGSTKNSVWVGIVSGNGKPQVMQFGNRGGAQDGFCSSPKKITITPMDCKGPEDTRLPGCQPIKQCKEFAVIDGDCDPFNFSWNSKQKLVQWWRN